MTIKEQIITARKNGKSYGQIYNEFGIPKSTARDWVNAKPESELVVTPYYHNNLQRDKIKRFTKTEDEVLTFLEQLAPINIVSKRIKTHKILSDYAVVGSDFHFGCSDPGSVDIFLSVVEELQPKTIILNGDTMDFLAISRFPKDLKKSWSLQDERLQYHEFLYSLINIAGGANIYETTSNHSGASIDGRWRRYLSDRLGELGCLPEITETLSYENVFLGNYKEDVEHVDYVDLNGLIVTHGTTVRSNGGASCLAEINKWKTSILHGHTHRIGSSCQRIPSIGGKPEGQVFGFEGGCLCDLSPCYGVAMNWQNGFNIISLGKEYGEFGVEQVMITNGQANIATLGKTIKAY